DVSSLPPRERNYGIVFQSYALFPNLTVARNVAYGLETRRVPRARVAARVDELLTLVGLAGHRHRYPSQLSGGEQQRVALARALAPSPALLLLDEPLSALDARVRVSLRAEIKSLQRRLGITTVMVTHDQEEALTMADRIVVMNHGVVEQIGTPLDTYMEPASLFVARFVGRMNVLPAVATERPGWARVARLELRHRAAAAQSPGTRLALAIRPEEIRVGAAAPRRGTRRAGGVSGRVRGVPVALRALPDGPGALAQPARQRRAPRRGRQLRALRPHAGHRRLHHEQPRGVGGRHGDHRRPCL